MDVVTAAGAGGGVGVDDSTVSDCSDEEGSRGGGDCTATASSAVVTAVGTPPSS